MTVTSCCTEMLASAGSTRMSASRYVIRPQFSIAPAVFSAVSQLRCDFQSCSRVFASEQHKAGTEMLSGPDG